jgi:hypothetical protein
MDGWTPPYGKIGGFYWVYGKWFMMILDHAMYELHYVTFLFPCW